MDIIKDISENKFLLVLLPESQYEEKLVEIADIIVLWER